VFTKNNRGIKVCPEQEEKEERESSKEKKRNREE
jgi:hypothetical protein